MRRSPIARVSRKRREKGGLAWNSSFSRKPRADATPTQSSPLPSPSSVPSKKKKEVGVAQRGAKITRKSPLRGKARVKKRRRSKDEMLRIYGPAERREWVRSLHCVACALVHPALAFGGGRCENAHTVTGGKGRKADYATIVPLCATHHRWYDEHHDWLGKPEVREVIKAAAAKVEAAWQSHLNGESK